MNLSYTAATSYSLLETTEIGENGLLSFQGIGLCGSEILIRYKVKNWFSFLSIWST